jgi:hypothetical protein
LVTVRWGQRESELITIDNKTVQYKKLADEPVSRILFGTLLYSSVP